ncbi:MAG: sporulation initiation factor Spo0A C-terminal domain-containing protein [Clostridia bacterium]|nr:sporulation initiation factor Spo0A C-terminal domain-containing protein [Clostridia bacterium]
MHNGLDIFEKKDKIEVLVSYEPESKNEEKNTLFEGCEEELLDACVFLDSRGISRHLCGYDYLMYAIVLTLGYGDRKVFITKEVYPCIAKHFKTGAAAVERSIRTAVRSGCRTCSSVEKVPSNSAFITEAAAYLKMNRIRGLLHIEKN